MLKTASFLTEVPEWTQPPKPPQDGTDLTYYKSIVICLLGLFQETNVVAEFQRTWGQKILHRSLVEVDSTRVTRQLIYEDILFERKLIEQGQLGRGLY